MITTVLLVAALPCRSIEMDGEILSLVRVFCLKAGIEMPQTLEVLDVKSTITGKPRFIVKSADNHFIVEDARVAIYSDAKLQMNMARRTPATIGQAVYTELQARALNAASNFLPGIAPGKATAFRANLRSTETISFAFYEAVGGVSTKGCGNLAEFGFDPVTKRIVQTRVESRYTYDERAVVINEAEAKARAIQLLRAHSAGASETIVSCKLQYIPISNGFGTESFEERRRLKRVGYGYAIRFARHLIFIDSRSGVSLGGMAIK